MALNQIPLSFPVDESYARDDFIVAPCNQDAYHCIEKWPDWDGCGVILYGESGAGKTHLLSILNQKMKLPHNIIDDVQDMIGDKDAEETLFHLYNRAQNEQFTVCLAMDKPPAQLDFVLPDLASRLRGLPQIAITMPDEETLAALMVKLFQDRKLMVDPDVLAYITPRLERSFDATRQLVDQIDTAALAQKRKVTIPLVKQIMEAEYP